MENSKKTEGYSGIEKLQKGGWKVWTKEEAEEYVWRHIKEYSPVKNREKVLNFIAIRNSWEEVPTPKEIKKGISLTRGYTGNVLRWTRGYTGTVLRWLKEKEMIFDFTMGEIIKFYGLDFLGFRYGHFNLPKPLKWAAPYLGEIKGVRSSGTPWHKKGRGPTSQLHYVGLVELDNRPCYEPLNLHIPKQQLLSV